MYDEIKAMLISTLNDCREYLDNYTQQPKEDMHRQRVKVADGQYRWVQGRTHDELNDNIVKAYVESGRIYEFIQGVAPDKPSVKTNFKEFAENWYSTYKIGLKPTSLVDYRYRLEHLLYPTFADRALQDITTEDIQHFFNDHRNVARTTLSKVLITLKELFKLALKEHLVAENPVDTKVLKIVSERQQERKPLSPEEYADVLSHIPDIPRVQDRRMIALMAFTGMRRGEVLGLRWEDIDFDKHLIYVRRNVTYANDITTIGTPKTKKSERVIPLDARLAAYLIPREEEGFILGGDQPFKKSEFITSWNRITAAIPTYNASPHIFRHTFATTLTNAGVPMKTVQEILGHASIQTTMDIYTHTSVDNIIDAGQKYAQFTSQ